MKLRPLWSKTHESYSVISQERKDSIIVKEIETLLSSYRRPSPRRCFKMGGTSVTWRLEKRETSTHPISQLLSILLIVLLELFFLLLQLVLTWAKIALKFWIALISRLPILLRGGTTGT